MKNKFIGRLAILTVMALILVTGCSSDKKVTENHLYKFLPTGNMIPGWSMADSAEVYTGEDLFVYIDGGAEKYLEHGFKQVITCEYTDAAETGLILEIFEMNDPAAAAAMYNEKADDSGMVDGLGDKSSIQDYYLNFTRGRYLVTLTGFEQSYKNLDGLVKIAAAVDHLIQKQN